jgi:hypothetical protein
MMLMENPACSMRLRLHGVLEARESVKICVIRVIRVPFKLNLEIMKREIETETTNSKLTHNELPEFVSVRLVRC